MYITVTYGVLLKEEKAAHSSFDSLKKEEKGSHKDRDNYREKGSGREINTIGDMIRCELYLIIITVHLCFPTKPLAFSSNNYKYFFTY
jgi:hypothetical protein